MYRCVALTPEGFIQQLAVCYVARGYWFYVLGEIPPLKEPAAVDAKIMGTYDVAVSKWTRLRRKRAGLANTQYLRHGRTFLILATHGKHELFEREHQAVRDARRTPIRFRGYSVSFRGGHVHVRIDRGAYLELKASMLDAAMRAETPELVRLFRSVPFEPYAPVRRQLIGIWRAVNRQRHAAGLDPVPIEAIRLRRRIMCPFGPAPHSPALLPDREECPGSDAAGDAATLDNEIE